MAECQSKYAILFIFGADILSGHFINFGDILLIFRADDLLGHFNNIWGHIINFCEETFYWGILLIFGAHFISNILWSFQVKLPIETCLSLPNSDD